MGNGFDAAALTEDERSVLAHLLVGILKKGHQQWYDIWRRRTSQQITGTLKGRFREEVDAGGFDPALSERAIAQKTQQRGMRA
jgi:hypothetical protein